MSSAGSFSHGELSQVLGPPKWLLSLCLPWMWRACSAWHIWPTFSPWASPLWDCTTPVGWPLGRFIYKMTLGKLLSKGPSFGPREPHIFVPLLVDKQFTPNVAFSLVLLCQAQWTFHVLIFLGKHLAPALSPLNFRGMLSPASGCL